MDKLAAALDIDAVELRLLNAIGPGDVLPTGQVVTGSLPVAEVIRRCSELTPPPPEELPRDPLRLPGGTGNTTRGEGVRRGTGFAVGFKNICYSEGFDDYCTPRACASSSGCRGGLAAEVLVRGSRGRAGRDRRDRSGRPHGARDRRRHRRRSPTTSGVGSAGSTSASRMTWMAAGAVRLACRDALAERARTGGDVDVERVYRHLPTSPLDPETGQVLGERAHVAFACAAMKVVAEVDVELGPDATSSGSARPRTSASALNPLAVHGQIEGGTAQGIGLALMEELQTDRGVITNASFTDYLLPTALDVPPIEAVLVEEPEPDCAVRGQGRRRAADGRVHGRGRRPRSATRPDASCRASPYALTTSSGCDRSRSPYRRRARRRARRPRRPRRPRLLGLHPRVARRRRRRLRRLRRRPRRVRRARRRSTSPARTSSPASSTRTCTSSRRSCSSTSSRGSCCPWARRRSSPTRTRSPTSSARTASTGCSTSAPTCRSTCTSRRRRACPRPQFESPRRPLTPGDLQGLLRRRRVIGLAEMMNFPGVIAGDPGELAKLALEGADHVDGHAPGVLGQGAQRVRRVPASARITRR